MASVDVQASLPFEGAPAPAAQAAPAPLTTAAPIIFHRHPRARRYVIRVSGDGVVSVTIPRWGSRRGAAEFADRERAWIEKQRRRAEQDRERPRPAPMPADAMRTLRARAKVELPSRLLELAAQHGLRVSRVSVRNQKWRWGSCSRTGHVCLNWRLVLMPDWVRDYVMIHELMHLKRMDHSPKFWKMVLAACPRYLEARACLRQASLSP
jgi:predicted metal-dependent hydrolase